MSPDLQRRLTTKDAVVVGLSAMIGSGVFVVFAPAARSAGAGLLLGLAIAASVAFCNAAASAQLAIAHPSSGGTYLFGRLVLGPWWGFAAGWSFVIGKTASCAAMAVTFATYAVPVAATPWHRLVAAAAVLVLTGANLRGVTRTALLARVLLAATSATLVVVVVVCFTASGPATTTLEIAPGDDGLLGILQAAGLLFFAFAGYARIATLAEEVRRPELLGRAILVALGMTVAVYVLLALALLRVLGSDLAHQPTPVAAAARSAGGTWAELVVRVGAAGACLGALLALLAGVGRTTLAMARERDLPGVLDSVHPVHRVPDRAQLVVTAAACVLIGVTDVRTVIGFSSFGVLLYYAVTNLSALRQPAAERRWPRALFVAGLGGCLTLSLTLPRGAVTAGAAVLLVGVIGRLAAGRRRRGSSALAS